MDCIPRHDNQTPDQKSTTVPRYPCTAVGSRLPSPCHPRRRFNENPMCIIREGPVRALREGMKAFPLASAVLVFSITSACCHPLSGFLTGIPTHKAISWSQHRHRQYLTPPRSSSIMMKGECIRTRVYIAHLRPLLPLPRD